MALPRAGETPARLADSSAPLQCKRLPCLVAIRRQLEIYRPASTFHAILVARGGRMARSSSPEVSAVRKLISRLPRESKRHVLTVAASLRQMVEEDEDVQEVELAFTLVLAELVARTAKH